MTQEAFSQLAASIQAGNNEALDSVYRLYFRYCTGWLQKKYNCTQADAEDIFMDTLLVFRQEVIKGKVSNKNVKGYLIVVAKNIYLNRLRKNKTLSVDAVEYTFTESENWEHEEYDPLLKAEKASFLEEDDRQNILALRQAWQKMGEACRKLLEGFYLDQLKLKDLQSTLGYGSYDSIKTMRRRCFNQLKKKALEQKASTTE